MAGRGVVATTKGAARNWRPVVIGFAVVAVLAIATAVVVALLGAGSGAGQDAVTAGPQPYGGQLGKPDTDHEVTSEQVLQVGMLALGTLNGMAFVVAMVASRLRGPSTAQTRRALIARTDAGVVSESRRERRERAQGRTAAPAPVSWAPPPVPAGAPSAGGPSAQAPRTPPPGAVPAQGGPAPREGLVPASRAPLGPPPPSGARPGPGPASPSTGVPLAIRPATPTRR